MQSKRCRRPIDRLLQDPARHLRHVARLGEPLAACLVEELKLRSEHCWDRDLQQSLACADLIIAIGNLRHNSWQVALGTMARGDALKHLTRSKEAWQALETAGELFLASGDEVGWARTRIGRLYLSVQLKQSAHALRDAELAEAILLRAAEDNKLLLLKLKHNTAVVHNFLGQYNQGMALLLSAIELAESFGAEGQMHLYRLYNDLGYAYEGLGQYQYAIAYLRRALASAEQAAASRSVAILETNIAIIEMKQGNHAQALKLLRRALNHHRTERSERDAAEVNRIIVECYLLLNRYQEAHGLAEQVVEVFRGCDDTYHEALTLVSLGTAQAYLQSTREAMVTLERAEQLFADGEQPAHSWRCISRLRRARIALQHGDPDKIAQDARESIAYFAQERQQSNLAEAWLLYGQALLRSGDHAGAEHSCRQVLQTIGEHQLPALRYQAQLQLGHVAYARGDHGQARACYEQAAATVEHVQRRLTINLQTGFLEDKDEALRRLTTMALRDGQPEQAFELLERMKSQALLSYLTKRQHLRWLRHQRQSQELLARLEQLRAEHHYFYTLAHSPPLEKDERRSPEQVEQARHKIVAAERQIRELIEQLYQGESPQPDLPPADGGAEAGPGSTLEALREKLDPTSLLIEFYSDGVHMWVFTLDREKLSVRLLGETVAAVAERLLQVQHSLNIAFRIERDAVRMRAATAIMQRTLGGLYAALLAPLAEQLAGKRRLIVVPHSLLHYLPFHLLWTGQGYLIEQHEVVVLPMASLLAHPCPERQGGALVLAHSRDDQLPGALAEAELIQAAFPGDLPPGVKATRAALDAPPRQILHIAAHGEHRLDNPDFSYIELADGHLYSDDLFQLDLSYELVTLSACETGRARISATDEPIGLGRGFLYAGAGALLASLWKVPDEQTARLMAHFYTTLGQGRSKAEALRRAYRAILEERPDLHPAFWGAFQLVGHAGPLSSVHADA